MIMDILVLMCLIAGFAGIYFYTGYLNEHEMVILTGIYLVANVTSCFFIVKTRRLAMQC